MTIFFSFLGKTCPCHPESKSDCNTDCNSNPSDSEAPDPPAGLSFERLATSPNSFGYQVLPQNFYISGKEFFLNHCVENSGYFSFTQTLREINFGAFISSKTNIFAILDALNSKFGEFETSKSAKIHKSQNSEPLNVLKWQVLRL